MLPLQEPIENIDVDQSVLFCTICDDLVTKSYSVQLNAIPEELIKLLRDRVSGEDALHYTLAGIGRSRAHHRNQNIRNNEIAWIDDEMLADRKWNEWAEELRVALNRNLFLGLTSFESHYARYQKEGFYRRHLDAFHGANNRKISIVLFLNDTWQAADEGELRLFVGPKYREQILIAPKLGTLAVFLSDEVPHEVLQTNCTRHSIAGWYR